MSCSRKLSPGIDLNVSEGDIINKHKYKTTPILLDLILVIYFELSENNKR